MRWSTRTWLRAVLARDLGAELLLILTDVDAIYLDWGKPTQRAVRRMTRRRSGAARRAKAQFGEGQHGAEGSCGDRFR